MSIAVSVKKFNGRPYVYICESFRDPNTRKSTSRVLESFGQQEKLLAQDPDAMAKIEAKAQILRTNQGVYSKTLEERLGHGVAVSQESLERPACLTCTPAPYRQIWESLGLDKYFKNYQRNHKVGYELDQALFLSCVSRLVAPKSKRATWFDRNNFIFDFGDVTLDSLYDSLDVLAQRKDTIIDKLNAGIGKMYQRNLTIALYDVTTYYFESFTEDALRSRGMSKEHRTQETQVVMGLLVDADGVPFTYELFPGNTAEVHTLIKIVSDFRRQYNIKDVTVIADSGLNQLINLEALEKAGFKYIVGYPPYSKLTEKEQEEVLADDGWKLTYDAVDGLRWGFKDMPLPVSKSVKPKGETKSRKVTLTKPRCIVTFSEKRQIHDLKELYKKLDRATKDVTGNAKKSVCKSGHRALIDYEVKDAKINTNVVERRETWAGYLAVLTNISEKDGTPMEIYKLQRQLWRIEDNFRVLKTNLQARPVFVWTEAHIRGHFLLNYIALVLQRLMLRQLKEAGLDLSPGEVIRALESMKVSEMKGLKKANRYLYSCTNIPSCSLSVTDKDGKAETLQNLCDQILRACGLTPLNALETSESIRNKLKTRLPLKKI